MFCELSISFVSFSIWLFVFLINLKKFFKCTYYAFVIYFTTDVNKK